MSIGPLMIDLQGSKLSAEEVDLVKHPLVGGIILFNRNFESAHQLTVLLQELRRKANKPLLIAVDQEGGRVQRFVDGLTVLPAAREYGRWYDKDPEKAFRLAENYAYTMASELLAMTVDMSFAPVLDIDSGQSDVIGDRSFHPDAIAVGELGKAFFNGMRRAGLSACAKHFPGHGSVVGDSHHEMPMDNRSIDDILAKDIVPFKALIDAGVNAVMPAHVVYSEVDKLPASLSSHWLNKILRQQLKFKGAIICDDLSMQGACVIESPIERVIIALQAGCDMLPICNARDQVIQVLDNLKVDENDDATKRIQKCFGSHMKRYGLNRY